jgi:hypothetical protein
MEENFYFEEMNREAAPRSLSGGGVRSTAVVIAGPQSSARVRVPAWATIARVQLAGGCSVDGDPGDALDGVMSVRAGTSLRVTLGETGSEAHPDGGATVVIRDGIAVVSAAGATRSRRRALSRPGPLWDVRMSRANPGAGGSVEVEFIGLDVEADATPSTGGASPLP